MCCNNSMWSLRDKKGFVDESGLVYDESYNSSREVSYFGKKCDSKLKLLRQKFWNLNLLPLLLWVRHWWQGHIYVIESFYLNDESITLNWAFDFWFTILLQNSHPYWVDYYRVDIIEIWLISLINACLFCKTSSITTPCKQQPLHSFLKT